MIDVDVEQQSRDREEKLGWVGIEGKVFLLVSFLLMLFLLVLFLLVLLELLPTFEVFEGWYVHL